MKLFLDCEFNGFGGELLSIALVSSGGRSFYAIVSDTKETPTEWVASNVLPLLQAFRGRGVKRPRNEIRQALQGFLSGYRAIHIIADWPEDIVHFCKLLLTDNPGERIDTPPLTMEIVRMNSTSEMPHNALADAEGIMISYTKA